MSIEQALFDIAPETKVMDSSVRTRMIGYATEQVGFASGTMQELAIAYLTAHMIHMSTRAGAPGSVASEKEGDLARNYGSNIAPSLLGQTSYGLEYLRIKRMFIIGARTRQV